MSLARRAVTSVWGLAWRWMADTNLQRRRPRAGSGPRHSHRDTILFRVNSRGTGRPSQKPRQRRACVYCGDAATTVDHLRPVLQRGGLPTGHGNDVWNAVPSCVSCNSSKGNTHWLAFMQRTTGKAPLARGVPPAVNTWRISRLRAFYTAGEQAAGRWPVTQHETVLYDLRRQLVEILTAFEARMVGLRAQVHTAAAGNSADSAVPNPVGRQRPQRTCSGAVGPNQAGWRTSLRLRRQKQALRNRL